MILWVECKEGVGTETPPWERHIKITYRAFSKYPPQDFACAPQDSMPPFPHPQLEISAK